VTAARACIHALVARSGLTVAEVQSSQSSTSMLAGACNNGRCQHDDRQRWSAANKQLDYVKQSVHAVISRQLKQSYKAQW